MDQGTFPDKKKQFLHLSNSIVVLQEKVLAGSLLFNIFDRTVFVNSRPEIVWISTECDAEQFQEAIHAIQQ